MITPYLVDPLQLQLNHSNLTVTMSGIISRLINFYYLNGGAPFSYMQACNSIGALDDQLNRTLLDDLDQVLALYFIEIDKGLFIPREECGTKVLEKLREGENED